MTDRRGLLDPALTWSTVMIFVSASGWLIVGAADVALFAHDAELLTRPLHSFLLAGLCALTVCSLMVRLAAHVITGQRRLMARLEEIDCCGAATTGYAEGYADGLRAPRPSDSPTLVRSRP